MRIVFDPDFDGGCWPGPLGGKRASAGEDWVGPTRFIQVLETALGLGGPRATPRERAARLVPAIRSTSGFWSASAAIDPFGAARRLLEWRDALAMAGWRGGGTAPRFAALSAVTAAAAGGVPDRLRAIQDVLLRRSPDIERVELFVSRTDLEPLWQSTLHLLEQRGTCIAERTLAPVAGPDGGDLAGARSPRFMPTGDGSLRLLRPPGPLAAAEEVGAWLASIGAASDTVIVGSDPALDAAFHRHGLPATGAAGDVNDHALLQLLPLVLDLGWSPQDPQRAYQLLSLQANPVPGDVAWRLREALARWPAVDSEAWREAMAAGLGAIEDEDRRARVKARLAVLWEGRVSRSGGYPAAEANRRGEMLRSWLVARAAAGVNASSWRAAATQCGTLLDLVRSSGLTELSAAQVRHLVSEATSSVEPESAFSAQAGIHAVGQPGGVAGPARIIVWWRFDSSVTPDVARLPLTRLEREQLGALGVALTEPAQFAAARARRWRRPIDQAVERLLLVCPEKDRQGEELHPHPVWDELVSRIGAVKKRRLIAEQWLVRRSTADVVPKAPRTLLAVPTLQAKWTVPADRVRPREKESPTSVERLLQCPFQWLLQYVAKLRVPDSGQVDEGTSARLLGELLHDIMNRLFEGGVRTAAEAAVEAGAIFDREGPRLVAALFLPGSDDQRERVRRAAVETARTLYRLMAEGGLKVLASERERVATAFGTEFAGRVDLVLGEPPRILDLKWGGATPKRQALKAGTAIQLAAYAFLERAPDGSFPPVGYFVMDAQRLFTTEPAAFPGAEQVEGPSPEETWTVLGRSYDDAWAAVEKGDVAAPGVSELQSNQREKKDAVEDGRLAMPSRCQWCDYTALCGLAFEEEL